MTAGRDLEPFRAAGRTLFSLGLVRGSEGNLSTFDGRTFRITRTGARLGALSSGDLVAGSLEDDLTGASSDVEVHRRTYRERGPGAVVHAHPAGTVPEGGGAPGEHGVYVDGRSLDEAVAQAVRDARAEAAPHVVPVEWRAGTLRILDQRRLPGQVRYLVARDPDAVADAIRTLAVRGAPLLGVTAGYGLALAAFRTSGGGTRGLLRELDRAGRVLVSSRPTAVNVAWAVRRVRDAAARGASLPGAGGGRSAVEAARRAVLQEAHRIAAEDRASCRSIGEFGGPLIADGANVLTHCNTGALATAGDGSAMAVIVAAHRAGARPHVWVGETRPLLQGARLTSWELQRLGIDMTLVIDAAAGSLMARGRVDVVLVGADRIAANGDVANKIGTYSLAVLARNHGIPFYVAAPVSTIDDATPTGAGIPIEERAPEEITRSFGRAVAGPDTRVANPAFDVTPASLVTAIVTDRGVAAAPYGPSLRRLVRSAGRASGAAP